MVEELDRLLEASHDGITVFDVDQKQVPCILFEEKRYDYILSKVAAKPVVINVDLNILQDGLGHVFVEVMLNFSIDGISEKILVNANKNPTFFESLAKTAILAISSPKSHYSKNNIFMINLPNPDKAERALGIIRQGLKSSKTNGAVTGI